MDRAAGPRRRKRRSVKRRRPSRQRGIPGSARAQWHTRKTKAGVRGVYLGKDENGYYGYRGKIRTASYKRPSKIPLGALRFIESARR